MSFMVTEWSLLIGSLGEEWFCHDKLFLEKAQLSNFKCALSTSLDSIPLSNFLMQDKFSMGTNFNHEHTKMNQRPTNASANKMS